MSQVRLDFMGSVSPEEKKVYVSSRYSLELSLVGV